jgi:hypothetical protein
LFIIVWCSRIEASHILISTWSIAESAELPFSIDMIGKRKRKTIKAFTCNSLSFKRWNYFPVTPTIVPETKLAIVRHEHSPP